jgi:ubiquinone/menaquinone biosynthesis methyltransferase
MLQYQSLLGPPQIGALLVLLQRGIEELYSRYNAKRLLAAGAVEAGRHYYPVMVVGNISWLAAVFFLLPTSAPPLLLPLCLYLMLQVARYSVITTLGRYWTHRIITLEGVALVRSGAYRYLSHPNYAIMIIEILLLPVVFGGWVLGIVAAALYAPFLLYKIKLEDRALARHSRATLRNMALEEYLSDPSKKQQYVTIMFDIIAPKYDRITRWFSFGMDAAWKMELLGYVKDKVKPDATCIDLASGTGDLSFAVSQIVPQGRETGIDISAEMVNIAKSRAETARVPNVSFRVGDMTALDLPENSVDLVTVGYGLRNVPDFRAALCQIARVLKPGGIVANLDFARPRNAVWRLMFLAYLSVIGNLTGWWLHGEGPVYGYISRSIAKFVTLQELSNEMENAGLEVLVTSPKLGGGVCLHVAQKRA